MGVTDQKDWSSLPLLETSKHLRLKKNHNTVHLKIKKNSTPLKQLIKTNKRKHQFVAISRLWKKLPND